ncbi:MAG: DUF4419 domain-containing protein [Bacteroidaceae bacterium]|nr:DUF4419 domain-containing protein [Bacteroidaceae bacterium]
MKKNSLHTLCGLCLLCVLSATVEAQETAPIISQTESSITFVVDENLPAPKKELRKYGGDQIAKFILNDEQIGKELYQIVATSFGQDSLINCGKDVFYQCIVQAYADHRAVCISPDMVWLLISQGFARYINAHAEDVRDLLVSHEGKMDLVVESEKDLLSGEADWPKLLDGFGTQIAKHTKNDIAQTITANFTTTGVTERIASEITLMESVKSYFNYRVIRIACGIPSITLKGTPKDWQEVLTKTQRLARFGLQGWVADMEPILTEFIHAAEGRPQRNFWQCIVKKDRVEELKGGGCSSTEPTELDGWLLKLFPDKDGHTLDKIAKTKSMEAERVRVGFKYNVIDPVQGNVVSETSMELLAGFVGIEEDSETPGALMPKIGWMVRIANEEAESLERLRQQDKWNGGIYLPQVKEVPEILSKLGHIKSLQIQFTDEVVLPEWMDAMAIDKFYIGGKLTKKEKKNIRKRFPNTEVGFY